VQTCVDDRARNVCESDVDQILEPEPPQKILVRVHLLTSPLPVQVQLLERLISEDPAPAVLLSHACSAYSQAALSSAKDSGRAVTSGNVRIRPRVYSTLAFTNGNIPVQARLTNWLPCRKDFAEALHAQKEEK
jgi:hypothetical protein